MPDCPDKSRNFGLSSGRRAIRPGYQNFATSRVGPDFWPIIQKKLWKIWKTMFFYRNFLTPGLMTFFSISKVVIENFTKFGIAKKNVEQNKFFRWKNCSKLHYSHKTE